jgi:hypothetical protein
MSESICARCDHPKQAHCKGNQQHTNHKEDSRMVPSAWRKGTFICEVRHCLNPLCSCVDFIEPTHFGGNDQATKGEVK